MINKICIIGVGLIGGSFALGLKKANKAKMIVGFDSNEDNLKQAQALDIIDEYNLDIATALNGVEMVLIATPVNSFEAILKLIKPHINNNVIISDVGSTKGSMMQIAKVIFAKMPARFIPAHPIAGKEKSGVMASDGGLFINKCVILTPADNANIQAIKTVRELWQSLGAQVQTMSAEQHDDLLAASSHLPHMLAFGLMEYLTSSNPDTLNYAAGGFKDFSRIASSNSVMWRDICLNNAEQIVKHIKGYQQSLNQLSSLISNKSAEELEQLFSEAKTARENWIKD